jgi:threonine synthase
LDPHSAIGYLGINNFVKKNKNCKGLFLGTAHPCKFSNIIEPIINEKIKIPKRIKSLLDKEKQSISLNNKYEEFSDYLLSNFE